MGSGTLLKKDQEKYGIDAFDKEYIKICDSFDEMVDMESTIVNDEFVKREDTYNQILGGIHGWSAINKYNKNLYGKNGQIGYGGENFIWGDELVNLLKERGEYDTYLEKISKSLKLAWETGKLCGFKNKKHSEESKKRIGEANSIYQSGNKNSQYGTKWIYNSELKMSKKIHMNDEIPIGWKLGRKIKF